MRYAHAVQGLKNAAAHLSSITQVDNSSVPKGERLISWVGNSSGIVRGVYYPLEYQNLIDRHQYSFLLADGSFFQFFYRFNDIDQLMAARLAYYPHPLSTNDSHEDISDAAEDALDKGDEDLFDHLFDLSDHMELRGLQPSNTSHIRFDFDRKVVSHSQAHLQFGAIQEFRVPAGFFPQPLAFVQMCESLLTGVDPLSRESLGFERNNPLALTVPEALITLRCETHS